MNDSVRTCPVAEALERFLSSALDEAELEDIAAHLNSCASCRARIERSADQSALADDVRHAARQREQTPVDVSVPVARLNELFKDYEVLGEIGRGGMGVVYKARQVKLNRMVALKVLPGLLSAVRPDAAARFRREAELAGRLKHTNIIAVYDCGEIDGTLYYAMELVEGRSLREVLAEIADSGAIDVVLEAGSASRIADFGFRKDADAATETDTDKADNAAVRQVEGAAEHAKREAAAPQASSLKPQASGLSSQSEIRNPKSAMGVTRLGSSSRSDRAYYRRVAGWIADVAEALDYAHEQGVIHRDVKPSNLLLARDGRLMISDFGLARGRGAETLTATRSLLGTARYMAPEQADEAPEAIDRRADVYGLGATLYELLTFKPMFAGTDDREVLDCVLNKEPAPPHRLVRQVPRELETICLKAVEKERGRRYATAKDLADDLRRWLLDLPIHARRPTALVRAGKFVRRRKLPVTLATLACVLAVAAAGWFVQSRQWRGTARTATAQASAMELELGLAQVQSDLDAGQLGAALARAESLLERYPDEARLWVAHARLLQQLDRRDEAIAELERLVAREPDAWPALFLLSLLHNDAGNAEQAARYAALSEPRMPADSPKRFMLLACMEPEPARAIELVDAGLQLDPRDIGLVLYRVRLDQKLMRPQAMVSDAERAVALRPQWGICHGYLGIGLIWVDRFDAAVAALDRAIEFEPKESNWWAARAVAKVKLKQYEAALFDSNRAIDLNPKYGRAYAVRGRARADLGEMAAGVLDCGRAIELAPTDVDNYLERLWLYRLLGDWEKVAADAARVVELRPDDPRGHVWRAESYLRRSQYEEAIKHYTRAIELDPTDTIAIHDRGTAFLRLRRLEEALADYTRCIQLDPKHSLAYVDRAQVYWRMGKHEEAMADVTRAMELGESGATAALMRAEGSFRLGRFTDALADCTRVLELAPDDPVALLRRGMASELTGQHEQAAADYERVTALGGEAGAYGRLSQHFLGGSPEPEAADLARANTGGTPWTDQLLAFAGSRLTGEGLLAAATDDDQRAEAYYYIGRQALLAGDRAAARGSFEKCVALDRHGILEVDFARALLKQPDEHTPPAATTSAP